MIKCPNCGSVVHEDDMFCGNCGKNLHNIANQITGESAEEQNAQQEIEGNEAPSCIDEPDKKTFRWWWLLGLIAIVAIIIGLYLAGFFSNERNESFKSDNANNSEIVDSLNDSSYLENIIDSLDEDTLDVDIPQYVYTSTMKFKGFESVPALLANKRFRVSNEDIPDGLKDREVAFDSKGRVIGKNGVMEVSVDEYSQQSALFHFTVRNEWLVQIEGDKLQLVEISVNLTYKEVDGGTIQTEEIGDSIEHVVEESTPSGDPVYTSKMAFREENDFIRLFAGLKFKNDYHNSEFYLTPDGQVYGRDVHMGRVIINQFSSQSAVIYVTIGAYMIAQISGEKLLLTTIGGDIYRQEE